MKKILVPTDFFDNARNAVQYATEIAIKSGTSLYLLHVIEPVIDKIRQPYPFHEKLEEEIANNGVGELKALQKSIAQMYPGIKTEIELAKGTVITSVLDFPESNQVDFRRFRCWPYRRNKTSGPISYRLKTI